ncbi:hypothetical protein EGW08_002348 [Elysia chlorotica]|uniref:tRNA (cytosine(38)-C(5))-methyltransferase n=1 Tax=Elysia chlorotica TaxID=188477 RepID=A0A3S1AEN7_ELYCH|nr:hypothetical protein EGW08_002348 [Elysia chlorotica]
MAASTQQQLRVLELYSGIGGMHWALEESGISYEVVMAVDINTTANKIYRHNFPDVNLLSFGLEKLSLKKLESLKVNAILMSPPCQPFTRVGKKGDCNDVRTQSFLHLLHLIRQLEKKPTYILVENVKGFETSQTRELLVECLSSCGYTHQEFLLTPLQFGIPNCRLRYYLVAKCGGSFSFNASPQVIIELPPMCHVNRSTDHCKKRKTDSINSQDDTYSPSPTVISHSSSNPSIEPEPSQSQTSKTESVSKDDVSQIRQDNILGLTNHNPEQELEKHAVELREAGRNMRYCEEEEKFVTEHSRPLSEFMETLSHEDLSQYLLSDKELRFFVVMDIVFPALKKSICFTKRYGHYVEGAGSVVQTSTDVKATQEASRFKSQAVALQNSQTWGEEELSLLRRLELRYFTPREVANLLCFPMNFGFPEGVSNIQKYRVLGNSLNVHVVSTLIKLMVT